MQSNSITSAESPEERARLNRERRVGARYPARIVASMRQHSRTRTCVIKDISVSGARLLSRGKFDVGSLVAIEMRFVTDDMQVLQAKVARVQLLQAESRSIWNYELGVAFEERLTEETPPRLSAWPGKDEKAAEAVALRTS